ncbi:MAG: flagellar biosynthesis regulator FlaF [Polaribacter sp.]|jgi:flagellar biosynthesis regulator FlaF
MNKALALFVNKFHPISLDEMNSVALMKRTDTKFVINISSLSKVLEKLSESYKVLEIKGQRIMNYSSLYLDTKEFKFYHDHHNGIVNRTKIRQRKYVDSDLTFLEIKKKNGKGETSKFRIKINDFETTLSDKSKKFISDTTNEDYKLQTSLWNSFNRITLVSLKENERVTIDFNLAYAVDDKEKKYSNIAVIELKQSRFDRKSLVVKVLKNIGHNPYSISKYCIGVANLYKNLKHNIFKPKLLKINNISN